MAFLRSLLFVLLFYPGTLLYVLTVIAVVADRRSAGAGRGPCLVGVPPLAGAPCLGIRIDWDGRIPDGAYLIAVKHQSMMEAVDTLHFANTPVVVMKRELTAIPLVRLGHPALRRHRRRPRCRAPARCGR